MKYTAYMITKPKDEGECKWCDKAMELIWKATLAGEIHDFVATPLPLPARQAYYKGSGTSTIPQIYMVDEDGFSEHVGGCDELVVWLEKRKK